jgi:hypothetical protein
MVVVGCPLEGGGWVFCGWCVWVVRGDGGGVGAGPSNAPVRVEVVVMGVHQLEVVLGRVILLRTRSGWRPPTMAVPPYVKMVFGV